MTTALAGGFFLKSILIKNQVFNRIVRLTLVKALNTGGL